VPTRQTSKYVVVKEYNEPIQAPDLSFKSWLRWIWKQVTSMKLAIILLLLLAAAAIPGSIFPQRSADPNGVTLYFRNNPTSAPVLDKLQLFDVYSSSWFSSIYLLLFISLIGCVLPRVGVHYKALRAEPPLAPTNLERLPEYKKIETTNSIDVAVEYLKSKRYKVIATKKDIRAEKGYLRETGNLIFHISLIGVLISVGLGSALSFSGQRVLVEGDTFVNNEASYDSLSPGLLYKTSDLTPFSLHLDSFWTKYDLLNPTNYGIPIDFTATVTSKLATGKAQKSDIKVNQPLIMPNAKVYLTGNGFAPVLEIKDPDGSISFSGPVVFLPQDKNLTSLGVIKVPDAKKQFGMAAFFYPTVGKLSTGALTSVYPFPVDPVLTMNVFEGSLGLESGLNSNAFELNTHAMKQIAGGKSGTKAIMLAPGMTKALPDNLGTVKFVGFKRYASLDITYNPGEAWVLLFAILVLLGLIMMLITPRRRIWVRKTATHIEIGALAKSRDEVLGKIVKELAKQIKKKAK